MKVRYKVDLIGYMAECDANYLRLMKLFPDMANGGERRIGLRHDGEHVLRLIAREQTAYTTLLELCPRCGGVVLGRGPTNQAALRLSQPADVSSG